MEEQKNLEPGKTIIGKIEGKYEGIYRNFTIYYGNVASPVINNNVLHLNEDEYMNMLMDFLESEEGANYRIPTKGEVKASIRELINKETEIKLHEEEKANAEKEEELEKEKAAQLEKEKEQRDLKVKEIETQQAANELRKIQVSNMKKEIKTQKIINSIVIAVCALQIILNVFLLYKLGVF